MFSAARSCCALGRRTYLLCYKDISVYDHNGRALGNCKSDIEFSGAYRHLWTQLSRLCYAMLPHMLAVNAPHVAFCNYFNLTCRLNAMLPTIGCGYTCRHAHEPTNEDCCVMITSDLNAWQYIHVVKLFPSKRLFIIKTNNAVKTSTASVSLSQRWTKEGAILSSQRRSDKWYWGGYVWCFASKDS